MTTTFYDLRTVESGNYLHLYLTIKMLDDYGSRCDSQIVVSWQANAGENDPPEWYGGQIDAKLSRESELVKMANLTARLAKKLESVLYRDPLGTIATIEEMRIKRFVYDSRLSEYIAIGEVKPPNYVVYRDDYKKLGNRYCTVSTLATSKSDAVQKMLKKLTSNEYGDKSAFIQKWAIAGYPITIGENESQPDTRPIADIVNWVR